MSFRFCMELEVVTFFQFFGFLYGDFLDRVTDAIIQHTSVQLQLKSVCECTLSTNF